MNIRCLKCKGADLSCGRSFCPIYAKNQSLFKIKEKITKEDFFGSAPSPFVGRYGYPDINVGILSPAEIQADAWLLDAPNYWADNNYQIPEIIDLRSSLVNSRFKANIKDQNKLLEISQEVGMSSKPVDIEINLKDKPKFHLNTDAYLAPSGPNARLKKARITVNPKIETKVDKVTSDTDMLANDALIYLYENNFDENFLSKLLSVGTIGLKENRKLVPTRWSITAADDTISKNILNEIRYKNEIDQPFSHFGSYLGNYFLILFFPHKWSYELFETYLPKASFNISNTIQYMTDSESFKGRTSYADNCGGGYYASRLPILEKLKKLKRQASVLTLRFITGEYAVPLGVWVVREAVRKSLHSKPIFFNDKSLMLKYAELLIKKRFNYNINNLTDNSNLLNNYIKQKTLTEFN
ncbi:Nre family DNA repair protein [Candidatus Woesearchaeota archaeon]|nr:Nre family DNA repair protein [Candidatus Woesearchaeota archaeon]